MSPEIKIIDACRFCAAVAIQQGMLLAGQSIDLYLMIECKQPFHDQVMTAFKQQNFIPTEDGPFQQMVFGRME